MHELSIAMSLLDIVTDEARKASSEKVTEVVVEIGDFAGVEPEALQLSWEMATRDTIVAGAPLVVENVEGIARCRECSNEFRAKEIFTQCTGCGSIRYDIISGRELRVKSIVVD